MDYYWFFLVSWKGFPVKTLLNTTKKLQPIEWQFLNIISFRIYEVLKCWETVIGIN